MKKRCGILIAALILCCMAWAAAEVEYEGKTFREDAEYIDLGDTVVSDFDAFEAMLDRMPKLKRVDMWANRMTKNLCDRLAKRFPDIQWGWTLVISNYDHEHLIRTDYTSWSTMHNNSTPPHRSEDFEILKYMWNLKALDIGHNLVENLDFLYDLPNLRILIIACNQVTDITPVGSLKRLEYAELFKNKISDLSPLAGMEHLLDLNICFNRIEDWSVLKDLKTLRRLWLYSSQKINTVPPESVVSELKAALPDTYIDSTHYSTAGTWRMLNSNTQAPHYAVIVANFGADHLHPMYEYVPFEESMTYPDDDPVLYTQAPTEVPTPEPTPEPTPAPPTFPEEDFSDKGYLLPIDFSAGKNPKKSGLIPGTSYSDSTIQVTVEQKDSGTCKYWVGDIQLKDASQLRVMAAGRSGGFDTTGQMTAMNLTKRSNAVLAINGDYFNSSERRGWGFILREGTLYRNNLDTAGRADSCLLDVLLIDEDGDFHPLHLPESNTIYNRVEGKRILHSFSFGPILVEDGKAVEDFRGADRWIDMAAEDGRQRMCLCQSGPLHYKVICCAGPYRGNTGMTLKEFAALAAAEGVQTAYNLDGGDSTWLYFGGEKINEFGSNSQRKLMDIIYFASGEGE